MRYLAKTVLLAVTLTTGLSFAATPLHAQALADLAKKCREMMVKAYPTQVFGQTGTAEKQRAYFKECLARRGDMPDAAQASSPGSGTSTGPRK